MNEIIRAVVTSKIGVILNSMKGFNNKSSGFLNDCNVALAKMFGNTASAVKNANVPAIIVEIYATPVDSPSNLPALFETWLIPGTINPTIISGIVNPKNELKIDEKVTKTLIIDVDRVLPKTIPNVTAIISFAINGILLYKLIVRSPFFLFYCIF